MRRAVVAAVLAVSFVVTTTAVVQASQPGWVADYQTDFNGTSLPSGWTLRDGYANQFPSHPAHHASFSVGNGHLTINIPGGEEHNMWLLRHAEALRAYEGSGVYQIKVDSDFTGDQQFGLSFESSPGTFMLFMLYAHGEISGYVERFVQFGGSTWKSTVAGFGTGHFTPKAGPYYIRVAVDDDANHSERTWTFEWSLDGATWNMGASGVFESTSASEDVGNIQNVSLFAGNHPNNFNAYQANFDYFYATDDYVVPPVAAPVVSASSSSGRVDLAWNQLLASDDYRVYRSTNTAGPFNQIAQVATPAYADLAVSNGTTYHYRVAVLRSGSVGPQSATVIGTPHVTGLEGIPSNGLSLALLASELDNTLAYGSPVSQWTSTTSTPMSATGSGSARPTLVSSGIGGRPSVRFDGSDDFLSVGSGFQDFQAGATMFVVANPTVLQTAFKMVSFGNGQGQQNLGLGRDGSNPGLQYWNTRTNGDYGWFNTSSGFAAGVPAVYSSVQAGGAVDALVPASVSRNGVVLGSGNVFVPPVANRGLNYIAKSYWPEGWFQGDIAEVLVYNRALSAAEQTTVNNYLLSKYGLTATPAPPAVPSGLAATAGNASVSLSWNAVSGATGYRVQRSTSAGGPFTQIADVATTTYLNNSGLTNGTTYHYVVTAYNTGGESAASGSVSATPQAPPTPPPGIPSNGLVLALDASSVPGGNGSPVSAWLSSSGGVGATGSGSERPTLVSSGIGGRPSVRFDGSDDFLSVGSGFQDFQAGATMFVVANPTVLQTAFKMVSFGNGQGQQNLGLGRDGSNPGLQYWNTRTNGDYGWFNTSSGFAAGVPAVYSSVQAGGAVDALVPASVSRNGVVLGSGNVFVPPVANRGLNYIAKSYWPEGWFQGDIAEVLVYNRALSAAEQTTVNNYLLSKYGLTATPAPPAVPSGLAATAGNASVSLSWNAVSGATGYRVQRSTSAGGPFTQIADVATTTYLNNSGLTNGTTYHYVVTAYNTGGESAASGSVSATPQAPPTPPPGIPSNGLVLALDASSVPGGNGSPVSAWLSSSGGVGATGSGSERPTLVSSGIGGRPSVRFDGSDDFLSVGSGFQDFQAGATMFVVANPTVLQTAFKMVSFGNGQGQQNLGLGRDGSNPGLQYWNTRTNGDYGWFNTSSGFAAGVPAVYSSVQAGGAVDALVPASVSRNGVVLGSGNVFVPPVANRGLNYIAKSYWPEGWFQGDIAEVLVYNRALSAAEQTTVNNYLLSKYGL